MNTPSNPLPLGALSGAGVPDGLPDVTELTRLANEFYSTPPGYPTHRGRGIGEPPGEVNEPPSGITKPPPGLPLPWERLTMFPTPRRAPMLRRLFWIIALQGYHPRFLVRTLLPLSRRERGPIGGSRGPIPCTPFRFRRAVLANARADPGCPEGTLRCASLRRRSACAANTCLVRCCARGPVPYTPFRFRRAVLANARTDPGCPEGTLRCASLRRRSACAANTCLVRYYSRAAIQRAPVGCRGARTGVCTIRSNGARIPLRDSLCRRCRAGSEPAGAAGVWRRHSVCRCRSVYSLSVRTFRPSLL